MSRHLIRIQKNIDLFIVGMNFCFVDFIWRTTHKLSKARRALC